MNFYIKFCQVTPVYHWQRLLTRRTISLPIILHLKQFTTFYLSQYRKGFYCISFCFVLSCYCVSVNDSRSPYWNISSTGPTLYHEFSIKFYSFQIRLRLSGRSLSRDEAFLVMVNSFIRQILFIYVILFLFLLIPNLSTSLPFLLYGPFIYRTHIVASSFHLLYKSFRSTDRTFSFTFASDDSSYNLYKMLHYKNFESRMSSFFLGIQSFKYMCNKYWSLDYFFP